MTQIIWNLKRKTTNKKFLINLFRKFGSQSFQSISIMTSLSWHDIIRSFLCQQLMPHYKPSWVYLMLNIFLLTKSTIVSYKTADNCQFERGQVLLKIKVKDINCIYTIECWKCIVVTVGTFPYISTHWQLLILGITQTNALAVVPELIYSTENCLVCFSNFIFASASQMKGLKQGRI